MKNERPRDVRGFGFLKIDDNLKKGWSIIGNQPDFTKATEIGPVYESPEFRSRPRKERR